MYTLSPSYVFTRVAAEGVLTPVANNVVNMTSIISLNQTSAAIIEHLEGGKSYDEIVNYIMEVGVGAAREQVERDVTAFLAKMTKAGYVVNSEK